MIENMADLGMSELDHQGSTQWWHISLVIMKPGVRDEKFQWMAKLWAKCFKAEQWHGLGFTGVICTFQPKPGINFEFRSGL